MDLADHFRIILRNWWRIIIVSLLVAGAVYYLSGRRPNVYETSATMSAVSGLANTGAVAAKDQDVFLAQTYGQLATTRPVVGRAVQISKLGIGVDTGLGRVSSTPATDIGALTLTAQGPNPRDAATLTNGLAAALQEAVNRQQDRARAQDLESVNAELASVQTQLAQAPASSPLSAELQTRYTALLEAAIARRTQPRDRVEVLSAAQPPGAPVSPSPTRDAALGFVVALVIAAELSVAVHALGDRLPRSFDPESVGAALGFPVLASVPMGHGSGVVEAFRTLRTSLAALPPGQRPRTVAITSVSAGAGKSFTAINLAQAAGAQQQGVLLVDADLRRPVINERLDIEREPGLTDILAGANARGALHSVGVSSEYAVASPRRFLVLPSGRPVPDPVAILSGDALKRVEASVEDSPQLVIVDTPPAALFGDALAIGIQCDAVLLVVDARRARRRALNATIGALERSGARILGVVVNRVRTRTGKRYSAYR